MDTIDDRVLRGFDRSLPMALLRAREAVMKKFTPSLRANNMSAQQWRVIRALNELDGLDISELSDRCHLLMPSLSRIVHGLESRALVERRSDQHDLRSVRIRIAGRGTALLAEGAQHSEQIYANIASAFGEEQIESLYRLLDALVESLGPE